MKRGSMVLLCLVGMLLFPLVGGCEGNRDIVAPPEVERDTTGGVLVVDTLHVWGALPGHNAGPEFKSDDVEGVYRIVMHRVVFNYDEDQTGFGDPVPLEYRVSNHFVLDDPRR
ncbi:MAG: hypothetical protein JSV41_07460 [Gemmatimonadota bacterium]|nr:MAG: hypothetical protein JSV41_07460 [Gemmatimonadota bacterium]